MNRDERHRAWIAAVNESLNAAIAATRRSRALRLGMTTDEEEPMDTRPDNPYDRRRPRRHAEGGALAEEPDVRLRRRRLRSAVTSDADHAGLTVADLSDMVASKVDRARLDGEEGAEERFEEIKLAAQRDAYDQGHAAGSSYGARRMHRAMVVAAADRLSVLGMRAIELSDPKKKTTLRELREGMTAIAQEARNIMGLLGDRVRPELVLNQKDSPLDDLVREVVKAVVAEQEGDDDGGA